MCPLSTCREVQTVPGFASPPEPSVYLGDVGQQLCDPVSPSEMGKTVILLRGRRRMRGITGACHRAGSEHTHRWLVYLSLRATSDPSIFSLVVVLS